MAGPMGFLLLANAVALYGGPQGSNIVDPAYLRVDGNEFVPEGSEDTQSRSFSRLYAIGGSGVYGATAHLPQGVFLTSLEVDACDSNAAGNHVHLTLLDCDRFGNCSAPLGQVESVSDPAQPCASQSFDLSSLHYLVDNARRALYLRAVFGARDRSNLLTGAVIGYGLPANKSEPPVSRTTVRQGGNTTDFRSPMVIETPFFVAGLGPNQKEFRDWKESTESLYSYRCDGVQMSALHMRTKDAGGGKLTVRVKAAFANPHSHDKSATLDFEVYNGNDVVSKFRIGPVRVDETDTRTRETEILIPRSSLIQDPITMMRITMTVADQ